MIDVIKKLINIAWMQNEGLNPNEFIDDLCNEIPEFVGRLTYDSYTNTILII